MAKTKPKKKNYPFNIPKTMGARGSLHKAMGINPKTKIGSARLQSEAAKGGSNGKKAELALLLNKGKKKKK